MAALLEYRSRFPILSTSTYLISNSLGAMPLDAERAAGEYASKWATDGVRAWQEWWQLPRVFGDAVAPLLGVANDTVSIHPNVTSAHAVIASCFDWRPPRNRVVYCSLDFPSVAYLWQGQKRFGADICVAKSRDGTTVATEDILALIDERTAVVSLSHVMFKSAFILDVEPIAKHCREAGALFVLDVYQSAGVIPVKCAEWGVDVAIGGTLKWLCGGPGVAFMYVDPNAAEGLVPSFTGWMSDEQPFAFDIEMHRLVSGAYRFANGTPNIPGLYVARPGLEIVKEIGIEAIRENSMKQTAALVAMADERGWRTNAPRDPSRRGGTVAFDLPNAFEIASALIERRIMVDYRPDAGVRVSPHFYTTDEEIAAFFDAVDSMLKTGSHLIPRQRTVVT